MYIFARCACQMNDRIQQYFIECEFGECLKCKSAIQRCIVLCKRTSGCAVDQLYALPLHVRHYIAHSIDTQNTQTQTEKDKKSKWRSILMCIRYLLPTSHNQYDNTICHCERNMSASNVLNTNNIVDISHDNTYQRLSLYTDHISVRSTSHIMLHPMLMPFYRYYMY